ncbi:hypothetical protein ACWD25_28955 [Streptomyces sp. NPDC002920]
MAMLWRAARRHAFVQGLYTVGGGEGHRLFGLARTGGQVSGESVAVHDEPGRRDGDGARVDADEGELPMHIEAGKQFVNGRGGGGLVDDEVGTAELSQPELGRELDGEVAQAAEPEDGDPAARPPTLFADGIEGRHALAAEQSGVEEDEPDRDADEGVGGHGDALCPAAPVCPQLPPNQPTATRSPIAQSSTRSPISTMTPATSCPGVTGKDVPVSVAAAVPRSALHTPLAATDTRTHRPVLIAVSYAE